MGSLTNSSSRLAYYAGMYKGLQSAGAAIMYDLDRREEPYMALFLSNWGLLVGSIVLAFPVAFFMVQEHSEDADADQVMEPEKVVEQEIEMEPEKPMADQKQ